MRLDEILCNLIGNCINSQEGRSITISAKMVGSHLLA